MTIRRAEEIPVWFAAGDRYRFLVTGDDSGGAYALWHTTVPPGGGPPLHRHSREDERFDILRGTIRFRIEDEEIDLGPGDSVLAPRGVVHAFRNVTDEPAEMLIHVTPGGMETMFEKFGERSTSPDEQPRAMTEADVERIASVCADYSIEILGPPIGHSL